MSYYCKVCNKTIKHKPKKKLFNSLTHKAFDKCNHIKLNLKNPDINKIDYKVCAHSIIYNEKHDYYLLKGDFELVFNKSEYSPQITSK